MTKKEFEGLLKKKDPLLKEIIKNHIVLIGGEYFVDNIWRYYNGQN